MNPSKKTLLKTLLLAVLIGLTFYWLFRDLDMGSVLNTALNSNLWYIGAAMLCMVGYIFFCGYSIRVMITPMGKRMSIYRCFKYAFIDFYFSAITPSSTGGQPMQVIAMRRDGYDATDSTVILISIAALYKISLLAMFGIIYFLNYEYLSAQVADIRFLFWLGLALNVFLIALIIVCLYSRTLSALMMRFIMFIAKKFKFTKDPEALERRMRRVLEHYHLCADFLASHPMTVTRCLISLTLQRVMLLLVPYCVCLALGLTGVSVFKVMGLQMLLSICCDMMPLPGAVGISERVFLALYSSIFGAELLYPAVMMSRSVSFYLMLLVSGLFMLISRLRDHTGERRLQ